MGLADPKEEDAKAKKLAQETPCAEGDEKSKPKESSLSHAPKVTRNAKPPEESSLKKPHALRVTRNARPKENSLSHAPRVMRNAKPPEESSLKMDQPPLRKMPRRKSSPTQKLRREMPKPRNE